MEYNYSKKSIWKWILLYVIIGVVVCGAIYYFFSPQNYQTRNIETKDWKTFYYHTYKFQYPLNWNIWMTLESEVPIGCFAQGDSVCASFNGTALSINTLQWDEKTCRNYYNGAGGPKAVLQESKIINGQQFYYGKFEDDNLEIYHAFLGNSCIELAKTISSDESLNKILSTFKFNK